MHQPHHHVRHLHAGVVDVVLHPDLIAALVAVRPQQALKRIAQDRVAQVPDVRCLVGIDAGVLHQPESLAANLRVLVARNRLHRCHAVQPDVQVPRARDLHRCHARQRRGIAGNQRVQLRGQLRRNQSRSLAQPLGQLERHRQRQLAQCNIRRLLHSELRRAHLRRRDSVLGKQNGLNAPLQRDLNCANHACVLPDVKN
jgi:hypothetical protein